MCTKNLYQTRMFLAASLVIVPNETESHMGKPVVMPSHRNTSIWHSNEKEAATDTSNNTMSLKNMMDNSI